MKFSRRGILKALPAIPFAAKRAATALAETIIDPATGIKVVGHATRGSLFNEPVDMDDYDIVGERRKETSRAKTLFDWVSRNGIPNWKLRSLKKQARRTRQLDPDIAVLRSVALHHKLRMQWAREEKRLIDLEYSTYTSRTERDSWLEKLGIDYW